MKSKDKRYRGCTIKRDDEPPEKMTQYYDDNDDDDEKDDEKYLCHPGRWTGDQRP
jgi:hypothetical protein